MKLLLLDNYDSFTWNLAQYLAELGATVDVKLHDQIDLPWCARQGFDAIVISPGPCTPREAGISGDTVRSWAGRLPILGVCQEHAGDA